MALERDLSLYDDIRRLYPIIDSAIVKTTRLLAGVEITGSAQAVADLTDWARMVQVNQTGRGLEAWLSNHFDAMLTFGKGVGEIVPNTRRDDVYALTNLDPKTILLRGGATPLELRVFQRINFPPQYVELAPGWVLLSAHNQRGDDVHGTSLLRTLPHTAENLSIVQNAQAQLWEREGAPSYHVNWKPDPSFIDPDGLTAAKVVSNFLTQLSTVMGARKTGEIQDFGSSGEVTVEAISGNHRPLDFQATYRVFAEQMVAVMGLPSWLLGLHWATTERLSALQAEMMVADLNALRAEVQPVIEYVCELRQRLAGRSARFSVGWKPVTLHDLTESASAANTDARTLGQKIENARRMWALGWWTQLEAGQSVDANLVAPAALYTSPPEGPSQPAPATNQTSGAGVATGSGG